MTSLKDRLRAELTAAMRERRRSDVAALRSALAAIGNAEAVATPDLGGQAIEQVSIGAGTTEARRRDVDEQEVAGIVEAEIVARDESAEHLLAAGRPDDAATHRAQADLLRALVSGG